MKKISDYKSLDSSMSDLCKFELKNDELTNEMNERIQALRAKYSDRLEALSTKSKEMRVAIIAYARANRQTLFPLNRKSLRLTNGVVGYRQGRASLQLQEGNTWDDVLEALQEAKAKDYIRIKFEVNRSLLLSRSDDPKVAKLISRVGLQVISEEQYYVETK